MIDLVTAENGLDIAFEEIRNRLQLAGGCTPKRENESEHTAELLSQRTSLLDTGRVAVLAERFELDPFERDLVILAAFAELEPDAAELFAAANGNPQLQSPTITLAFSVLDNPYWSALAPTNSLQRYELLDIKGEGGIQTLWLELPTRVLYFLLGVESIDKTLLLLSQRLTVDQQLAPSLSALATDLAKRLVELKTTKPPVLQLCGADRNGKLAIVAKAANKLGQAAFLMPIEHIPATVQDRALLKRHWDRELRLENTVLVLDAGDLVDKTEIRIIGLFADALEGRIIILAIEPLSLPTRSVIRIDIPRSKAAEQKQLWQEAFGANSKRLNGSVDRLANHFTLNPGTMAAVNTELEHVLATNSKVNLDKVVWSATRRQTRPQLEGLAKRIPLSPKWNDLEKGERQALVWNEIVLPKRQLDLLKLVASQVQQRAKVYEQWGFADRSQRGLGISALFVGSSGTGKTLAAEIMGAFLELDVYQIDLSSVVSKWIGETEKNLRRIFDAADESCAILLFDEADALFGKRSEVTNSHDRHANIEVSYLLQRMESYRGLAILTTNLQNNIDDAFLRRIRFIVEFPFPEATERHGIWSNIFPGKVPLGDLQQNRLAQLNVAGGSIRNIAINAAFNAATECDEVSMKHILSAARLEYDKVGRSLTDSELRGWPR